LVLNRIGALPHLNFRANLLVTQGDLLASIGGSRAIDRDFCAS
jgi:hypothetical protein